MAEARLKAISTYRIFLVSGGGTKLVDIKDFPALGGEPELLDTTTLSDPVETKIPGIQKLDALTFTANYNKEDYEKLLALKGEVQKYGVWFGGTGEGFESVPTGDKGKWEFEGQLDVYVDGQGVNEVVNMKITIAASSPISYVAGD